MILEYPYKYMHSADFECVRKGNNIGGPARDGGPGNLRVRVCAAQGTCVNVRRKRRVAKVKHKPF